MNVTELIAAVGGDDAIGIQSIDLCATSLDWNAKNGTKITFRCADVMLTGDGTDKFGMVIWMDRAKVREALALATGRKP